MGESRKDVLMKALEAEISGGSDDLSTLFTDDVIGWSPYATVSGMKALRTCRLSVSSRSRTSSSCSGARRSGQQGVRRMACRSRPHRALVLGEDASLEATGQHVQLAGVTVADFREGKIRSYRTYFDDLSLIEQLVGA